MKVYPQRPISAAHLIVLAAEASKRSSAASASFADVVCVLANSNEDISYTHGLTNSKHRAWQSSDKQRSVISRAGGIVSQGPNALCRQGRKKIRKLQWALAGFSLCPLTRRLHESTCPPCNNSLSLAELPYLSLGYMSKCYHVACMKCAPSMRCLLSNGNMLWTTSPLPRDCINDTFLKGNALYFRGKASKLQSVLHRTQNRQSTIDTIWT